MSVSINFEGVHRPFKGNYVRRSKLDRLKLGAKTWAICWLFALAFVFVPYVNISVFMVFIPLGPVAMGIIYLASRQGIRRIDGTVDCARCEANLTIREANVTPPIYGHCPHCRCSYEILVPADESRF